MITKKPRAPMTPEHKAKLKAAQEAKKLVLAEQRANNDPKLSAFITEFLYPLIVTFQAFMLGKEQATEDGNIKYVRYQREDKFGRKLGPISYAIEVSVLWLEATHGRRAAGLFKKLFKRTAKGGWSRINKEAFSSSWVPNQHVYDEVIKQLRKLLTKNDRVKVWEFIQLIETTVEFQYVATVYFAEKQDNGFYKCVGRRDSRRMLGPDKRAIVDAEHHAVKLKVDAINAAMKEQTALERVINIEMELKLRAVKARIEQLTAELETRA